MSKWQTAKLGDICVITSSKRIFAHEYRSDGVPFYRGKEIIEKYNGKNVSNELFIEEQRFLEISNKHGAPQQGDLLLTSVGTLGVPYIVENERFYFKDGNITWFRNFDGAISKYVYYWLLSPQGRQQIDSKSIGSTQRALTIDSLLGFEMDLPPIEEQHTIAATLSCLDDKIALNRRINATLEQMAQAIYSDFVTDIDGTMMQLKHLCAFQEGYVNPSQNNPEYFDGEVKWLRAVDINESFIFDTSRTLTNNGFESAGKSAFLFKPDTVAISKSGTIGRLGFIADFMCGNRAVINIAPNDTRILPFIYLYLKSRQPEFFDLAVGSVQKNLYVPILQELEITVPQESKLYGFCDTVSPLFNKWKNNVKENNILIATRDALLPRLMSGNYLHPNDDE